MIFKSLTASIQTERMLYAGRILFLLTLSFLCLLLFIRQFVSTLRALSLKVKSISQSLHFYPILNADSSSAIRVLFDNDVKKPTTEQLNIEQ